MRILIQRVKTASVSIDGKKIAEIQKGLLILLGVKGSDTEEDIKYLVEKIINLRIFEDRPSHICGSEAGKCGLRHSEATLLMRPKGATLEKMNLSLLDVKGELLIVSQFTLYADCRKGRRPSFTDAAEPEFANEMYKKFVQAAKATGLRVEEGEFGAMMDVNLVNWGPVTIML